MDCFASLSFTSNQLRRAAAPDTSDMTCALDPSSSRRPQANPWRLHSPIPGVSRAGDRAGPWLERGAEVGGFGSRGRRRLVWRRGRWWGVAAGRRGVQDRGQESVQRYSVRPASAGGPCSISHEDSCDACCRQHQGGLTCWRSPRSRALEKSCALRVPRPAALQARNTSWRLLSPPGCWPAAAPVTWGMRASSQSGSGRPMRSR